MFNLCWEQAKILTLWGQAKVTEPGKKVVKIQKATIQSPSYAALWNYIRDQS